MGESRQPRNIELDLTVLSSFPNISDKFFLSLSASNSTQMQKPMTHLCVSSTWRWLMVRILILITGEGTRYQGSPKRVIDTSIASDTIPLERYAHEKSRRLIDCGSLDYRDGKLRRWR